MTSYGKILQIFFSVAHDPTQLNRQADFGTQYRAEIFAQSEAQRRRQGLYRAARHRACSGSRS